MVFLCNTEREKWYFFAIFLCNVSYVVFLVPRQHFWVYCGMQLHEGRVPAAGLTLLCISARFRYSEMTSHFFNFLSILLLFYYGSI